MEALISVLLNLTGHLLPGETLVAPLLVTTAIVAAIASGMAGRIATWCAMRFSRS